MSHIIKSVASTPSVPTAFTGNTGTAVPALGVLSVVGIGAVNVAAAGNTLTISDSGSVAILFDGDTGSATPSGGTLNIIADHAGGNAGNTVLFSASGNTVELIVTDSHINTCIGQFAGGNSVLSGGSNTFLGFSAGSLVNSTSSENTYLGAQCGKTSSGSLNTAVGAYALSEADGPDLGNSLWNSVFGAYTANGLTGSYNCILGTAAAQNILGGNSNTIIGTTAGDAYTTTESSNIIIGNNGVTGDSHQIRIGTQGSGAGQQNACLIAGITSSSITAGLPVFVDSSGNLGTTNSTPFAINTWANASGSTAVVAHTNYVVTAAATMTMPASPPDFDTHTFITTAAAVVIKANTSQFIRINTNTSTSAGTCTNGAAYETITLTYNLASTQWIATSSQISTGWSLA